MTYKLFYTWWRSIDKILIILSLLLLIIGLNLVFTSSIAISNKLNVSNYYFVKKQLYYGLLGLGLMCFISTLKEKDIIKLIFTGLLLSIFFSSLLTFFGSEVNGSKRWIKIFNIAFQPSEFLRTFFICCSSFLLHLNFFTKRKKLLIACFTLFLLVISFLLIQPDIGMTIIVTSSFIFQCFISGLSIIVVIISIINILALAIILYYLFPHVSYRINNFLQSKVSYQVSNALKAFNKGGLSGSGLGKGTIKQYLPDCHTDFIFAVACEECGVVFCIFILFLFIFLVIKTLYKSIKTSNSFCSICISSLSFSIGVQVLINMSVNLNIIPPKGITLPLISYGGSSLISTFISLGIILALGKRNVSYEPYRLRHFFLILNSRKRKTKH